MENLLNSSSILVISSPSVSSIVPGDLSPGTLFPPPVRTLAEETIPSVSGPPGNAAAFQARAGFLPLR
jgi:hypothetical protein